MKRVIVFIVLVLLFSSIGSAFTFADFFRGNLKDMMTGSVIVNNAPTVTLGFPSDNEVVAGTTVNFKWKYNDVESDPQVNCVVHVDGNRLFNSPLAYFVTSETSKKIKILTGSGDYFYRVKCKDDYAWGKWTEVRGFHLDDSVKVCEDGTLFWECSQTKPLYCDGGVLTDDCQRCGCHANEECQASGRCLANTCFDNTKYGECSISQPKYCQGGDFRDVCSLCGCPVGKDCQSDGSCEVRVEVLGKEDMPTPSSVLGRIADFFKRLFGRA